MKLSYKSRRKNYGLASAASTFVKRFCADVAKFAAGKTLKFGLFYPIVAFFRLMKAFRKNVLRQKVAPDMQ